MKVCLRHDQQEEYHKKADQIEVKSYYVDELPILVEKYPDKDFIVDIPKNSFISWRDIKACEIKLN